MKSNTSDNTVERKLYRFAFARVSVLALLALLCAGALIALANDLYAFVKPDHTAQLQVDQPRSLEDWAKALEQNGIIQNPTVFRLYVQSKGKTDRIESFCGEISLNAAMSYREILLAFAD